jgi:hypothetical protein
MRVLSDSELLAVWERGHRREGLARALLLAAESAEVGEADAAGLCVGERNAAILRLRNGNFGPDLRGHIDCPRCAEQLEFSFDSAAALARMHAPEKTEFSSGEFRFRLPTGRDLAAVADAADFAAAARLLVRRCCLDELDAAECTDDLLSDVGQKMEELDAGADLRFGFACSACGHSWVEHLDLAAWCWAEIELRAQRLFDQIHRIAGAYGWTESQILALGEARRRAYLARCDA